MRPPENGFPGYTPFYPEGENNDDKEWWRDPEVCPPDMSEEECRTSAYAVDITLIMGALDCTGEDMTNVLDNLFKLLDGEISEIDYVCMNGNRIRITMNADGEIEVETEPRIEFD